MLASQGTNEFFVVVVLIFFFFPPTYSCTIYNVSVQSVNPLSQTSASLLEPSHSNPVFAICQSAAVWMTMIDEKEIPLVGMFKG